MVTSKRKSKAAPLASRVRLKREEKSWTQAELAAKAGTTEAEIEKIENGKNVHPGDIEAIADALDVSPWWLMFGANR